VLEHLDDAERAVIEFSRVLRSGGRAWIAVPNGYGDMWPGFHRFQRHVDAVEGHVRHFTDRDLAQLFSRHGFALVGRRYDLFVGLYLYYRFVSYNPALKRQLIGSFVPPMGAPAAARTMSLPKRIAVAAMFTVLRTLRQFDNCFAWYRGCQVVEVTLIRRSLEAV
jgi:SAM-dependent methyltransferase